MCPGQGAQELAPESRRDARPGMRSVSKCLPRVPRLLSLRGEGEGMSSGPVKRTRTWLGPLVRSLTGWVARLRSPYLPGLLRPTGGLDPAAQDKAPEALKGRVPDPGWAGFVSAWLWQPTPQFLRPSRCVLPGSPSSPALPAPMASSS